MLPIKKELRDLARLEKIADVLVRQGFGYYIHKINKHEKLGLKTSAPDREPLRHEMDNFPSKLKEAFEQLGGAFIKLGQLLSLRPDLIPQQYCDQFSEMQDSVPPFPYSDVKEIVEKETGKPLGKVFSRFDKIPIAAASIGQVHEARLLSGERVVVKVQRPKIREQIESDIDILFFIATLLEKHFEMGIIKPTAIIREFESYTERELDFMQEARNLETIYHNFRGSKSAKIPRLFKDYTTSRILVLEFIDGMKLSNAHKLTPYEKKIVADNFMNSIYKMVFIDGVFHADPHPGNVIVIPGGEIAFIDFGIVGYVNESLKEKLTDLFVAAVEKDINGIADAMIDLGVVKRDVNREDLKQDIAENFAEFYSASLSQIRMSELFKKVLMITRKHKIKLPTNFILLAKCAMTAESVVLTVDPGFNPVEKAKPFVTDLVKRRYSPGAMLKNMKASAMTATRFLFKVPAMTDEAMHMLYRGEKSVKMIHKDISILTIEMDRSSNRIALALIITALIIASAYVINLQQEMVFGIPLLSLIGFSIAMFLLIILLFSVLSEKHKI